MPSSPESLHDGPAKLMDREIARVDHIVRQSADGFQFLPFDGDRLRHSGLGHQGMGTPGFTVPTDQRGTRRLQKQQVNTYAAAFQLPEDPGKTSEGRTFTNIHHHSSPVVFLTRAHTKLGKQRNEINGEVINAVISEIFKGPESGSLAGTTDSRDDDELRRLWAVNRRTNASFAGG